MLRHQRPLLASSALLLTGGLWGIPAAAQIAGPPTQTATSDRSQDEIVVTGTAIPVENKKIGSALTVLDGERLRQSGYNYVTDALRQVPGVAVNRTGPFGGLTQIRIRGAEGNHTVVLFNGVDVSGAGQGETDLSRLLTGDIERIEILRGPQSGLYGSNALAGVINVLTRRNINGWYGTGAVEYGSFDTKEARASAGAGDGRSYVNFGVDRLDTGGFDSSQSDGAFPIQPWTNDKEGYRNTTQYVTGGYELAPIFRLDGFIRHQTGKAKLDGFDFSGIPGRQGLTFDNPSRTETRNTNYALNGTLSLLDDRWVTIFGGNRTDDRSLSFPGTTPATTNGATSGNEARRDKLILQTSFKFGSDAFLSTISAFAERKRERYQNLFPSAPSQIPVQRRKLNGVGGQYLAEIAQQLYVTATYRHDDNDTFKDNDTFGVNASWVIDAINGRLHGNVGRGVTNPSFFEQFGFTPGSFIGNPDLVPERANSWEIGYAQTLADDRLVLDATYFDSRLKDEIVSCVRPNPAPPPATLSSSCNSPATSRWKGVETSLRWSFSSAFELRGSYTYLDAIDAATRVAEVRRPKHTGALDAYWRPVERLNLAAGLTYNGRQLDNDFRTAGVTLRTPIKAYTLIRASAGFNITRTVELYARVENVFDEDYEEVISYATPGRAVYGGVRVRFGPALR